MGELAKTQDSGLIKLLHSKGGSNLPKPFEQEIFLFDTFVAGTTHIEDFEEIEPLLDIGLKLDFFREPQNQYDKEAIAVFVHDGRRIGYIPRADNLIFARLMDAGKLLFGKISDIEKQGNWTKISIKVYLLS